LGNSGYKEGEQQKNLSSAGGRMDFHHVSAKPAKAKLEFKYNYGYTIEERNSPVCPNE
jgi:hypothetical protein